MGWDNYHTLDSRGSNPDFPDQVFKRSPGYAVCVVVAEIKLEGKEPTPGQQAWLDAFEVALGGNVYVWTPADWPEIERVLGDQS